MIPHLRHQLVIIEEQQADHSNDEKSCTSGLQEAKEKNRESESEHKASFSNDTRPNPGEILIN